MNISLEFTETGWAKILAALHRMRRRSLNNCERSGAVDLIRDIEVGIAARKEERANRKERADENRDGV